MLTISGGGAHKSFQAQGWVDLRMEEDGEAVSRERAPGSAEGLQL